MAQANIRFSYYGFDHATMVPFCRNLVNLDLLSVEEKKWIDEYHATIYEKTKGYLEGDALKWVERETAKYS